MSLILYHFLFWSSSLQHLFTTTDTNGVYRLSQRYLLDEISCAPYENVTVDFHMLTGGDANYSGMARTYRRIQLERGAVRPISDRIASGESPLRDYLCDALPVRMTHASKPYKDTKNIDYTAATELPVTAHLTFDAAKSGDRESAIAGGKSVRWRTSCTNSGRAVTRAAGHAGGWRAGARVRRKRSAA